MDNVLTNDTIGQEDRHNGLWDDVPDAVKDGISEAQTQLLNNEGIDHESVMKEVKERFLKD